MSHKKYNIGRKDRKSSKISLFSMIAIAILAIFSFQNVIDNYVGMGLSATIAFSIAVIVFLFPFIFMIAEFASLQKSTKSGLTSWIHTAIGRKTSFLASFMFWFANLTYFFSAIPSRINFLSFAVTGHDYQENTIFQLVIPFACVALFTIVTALSQLSTKKLSKIISLGGTLMLILTGFFFIMAIIGWIAGAANPSLLLPGGALDGSQAPGLIPNNELNIWGDTEGLNFAWISTFIWVLMAADGGQSLGVWVNDVKGGKKAFVRSMIYSVMAIGFFYIFGTLLASVFPPTGGLAAGWANSFLNVFSFILSPFDLDSKLIQTITYVLIGLVFFITSIGGLIIWTSAPVKTMFSEIAPGIFGSRLSKQNRNGVSSFGLWVQFFLVIPFLVLLTWPIGSGSFSDNLSLIKSAAGWIGMLPWLVIFVAYVNLRLNRDWEERSFRMGNRNFGITTGIILIFITSAILVITFLDKSPLNKSYIEWPENWWMGPVMKVAMILIILVPTYLWYYFKYEHQYRDTKICRKNNLSTKFPLVKYSFTNKFVQWLNPEINLDYVDKKNKLLINAKNNFSRLMQIENEQREIKNNISTKLEESIASNNYFEVKKELSKADRDASKKIKIVNKKLRNNEQFLKQKISLLNKNFKIETKSKARKWKIDTNIFYKKNMKPLYSNYRKNNTNNSEFKKLLISEMPTKREKDIDFNNIDFKIYNKYNQYCAASYYSSIFGASKVKMEDKILMDNNYIIIIRNYAGSLFGEKFSIDNIKLFKEPIDTEIETITSGKWSTLKLVSIIHLENNQFEHFKIYVEKADNFITDFNNIRRNENVDAL